MAANHRASSWALVTIIALLLTACDSITTESDKPVSAPTRAAPLLSIHNPLVVQTGDTITSSGGLLHEWPPGVEVEKHGLRIFHPYSWLFASSQEELLSLPPQLSDSVTAAALLEERKSYFASLTPEGQEHLWAGMSFPDPNVWSVDTNGFHLLAVPSEGRTLETYARQLTDQLKASGFAAEESIVIGPGLRPWGEETALIRFRIDGMRAFGERAVSNPDAAADGWKVVLLSPDGGTFLTVTFDVWGEDSGRHALPFLLEAVRRVQWVADPAYEPRSGPSVTIDYNMNVRGGPGTDHSIIGKAAAGQQYAVISRNTADDWWQIEYSGRLAWVHGGYVTPSTDAADSPRADGFGWLTFEDDARGLSLSYPPDWHYFDPGRPTRAELALFTAARRYGSEPVDVAGMGQLVSAMSDRRDDAVIGLGLQSGPVDGVASNFMLLFSFTVEGQSLEDYAQAAAGKTYSLEPVTVELAQGLRPAGEAAVSIRYKEFGTPCEVWQVWLMAPDGKTFVALAFSIHIDEFEALEPSLREIVQRLRWRDL